MNALFLIVGKELCSSRVETVLTDLKFQNYMCVDGPDAADWLMQDGYSCDVLIVDRGLFDSRAAAEDWIASNPQAMPVLTDRCQIWSPGFQDQLSRTVRNSRDGSISRQTYEVH